MVEVVHPSGSTSALSPPGLLGGEPPTRRDPTSQSMCHRFARFRGYNQNKWDEFWA